MKSASGAVAWGQDTPGARPPRRFRAALRDCSLYYYGTHLGCLGSPERYTTRQHKKTASLLRNLYAIIGDMSREVVHLSQAEAIRDIAAILERVQRGTEVIVERDQRPVVVIQPAPSPGRLLSECIALAKAHGSTVTLDEGFARDLEEIINSRREPLDASRWD